MNNLSKLHIGVFVYLIYSIFFVKMPHTAKEMKLKHMFDLSRLCLDSVLTFLMAKTIIKYFIEMLIECYIHIQYNLLVTFAKNA